MPLDPNIIMGSRPVAVANPMQSLSQALMMRDLMQRGQMNQMQAQQMQRQYADQTAMRQAYMGAMVPDQSGQAHFDPNAYVSNLQKSAPWLAPQASLQMQKMQAGRLQQEAQMGLGILNRVNIMPSDSPDVKQQKWSQGLQLAHQYGLSGIEQMPQQYPGDMAFQHIKNSLMTPDQQMKQESLDIQNKELPEKIAQGQYYSQKGAQAQTQMVQQAKDNILKDPQVLKYQTRLQGVSNINTLLNSVKGGNIKDTPQLLNAVNQEYSALLTGSQNPALGKQERTEYSTYASKLAGLMQEIKANPQSINSPEILNQLSGEFDALDSDYRGFMKDRVDELKSDYGNGTANKAQNETISQLMGKYGPGAKTQMAKFGPKSNAPASDLVQVMAPNGRIKMIPSSMVNQAVAAGGKVVGQGAGSVAQAGGASGGY